MLIAGLLVVGTGLGLWQAHRMGERANKTIVEKSNNALLILAVGTMAALYLYSRR